MLAVVPAFATNHLAVLEIVPSESVKKDVSIDEVRFLSDKLRSHAVSVLPNNNYTVLTRENIIQLMPPDEEDVECLIESCIVEIGRAIGADYISQGTIGKFGSQLTISLELYATMSGKLLASFSEESNDINGLLAILKKRTKSFFSSIIEYTEQQPKSAQKPVAKPAQKPIAPPASKPDVSLSITGNFRDLDFYLNAAEQGFANYFKRYNPKKIKRTSERLIMSAQYGRYEVTCIFYENRSDFIVDLYTEFERDRIKWIRNVAKHVQKAGGR